jgi:predicted TIM-barrel fold metal-dependent hydrolase
MSTHGRDGSETPEDILFPDLTIVDPHVHMWNKGGFDYFAPELLADVHDGHKVVKTIYVECHMGYDNKRNEAFQPVGETEYVIDQVTRAEQTDHDLAAGILGCANLMLGSEVRPILENHIAAARGRFRGLRAHVAYHPDPAVGYPDIPRYPKTHVMRTESFLAGARCLLDLGLTLDIWALHTQLDDIADLAAKIPRLPIVIDHCGGPIGVGPYAGQRDEVFADWSAGLRRAATVPNLHIKLSGLGMARLGFRGDPARTSDELVAKWKAYVRASVDAFGPARSIFASNFPVDRVAGSYRVVLNAYKKMLADLPSNDLEAIFCGNAQRLYRL